MPRKNRRPKTVRSSAVRRVVAWLKNPQPTKEQAALGMERDNVLNVPSDAPKDWPSLLIRDGADDLSSTDLNCRIRFSLDTNGALLIAHQVGLDHYTDGCATARYGAPARIEV